MVGASRPAIIPSASSRGSERLVETGLFEHGIRRMAGLYGAVDGKAAAGDGAVPDFMIALAGAFKTATGLARQFFKISCVIRHRAATAQAISSS